VTIDGEPVGDINKILNSLLITEGERKVVVERGGKHVELTLPLDELIEMRQAKGYEDLFTLRVPFLIDSAVYESAAALRRGDEIVAIDDARGLEYSGYQQYLKTRAGGEVTLTVKREGDMLLHIAVPVSDEGKLGVIARNPYTLRTQEYTFWQSIPGRHRKGRESHFVLLGTVEDDRAAQDQDVRGAGRVHRHRQYFPRGLELGGFLVEDGVPIDHPRGDEPSCPYRAWTAGMRSSRSGRWSRDAR